MATARGLIKRSLRLVGAIASGETPSASDEADSLESLNAMLGLWSTQGLLIPMYSREVFLTQVGKEEYTMGPGGDWDTARPSRIVFAKFTDPEIITTIVTPYDPGDPLADPVVPETPEETSTEVLATVEYPIELVSFENWSGIFDKRLFSTYVTKLYAHGTSPLETISVYPVPNVQTGIVIYSHKPITSISNAALEFEFPEGYEDAVVYNLAVRLAPEYGKEVSSSVYDTAKDSIAMIKRANTKPVYAKSVSSARFNIYTGE